MSNGESETGTIRTVAVPNTNPSYALLGETTNQDDDVTKDNE